MRFEWSIAWRYLFSRKRVNAINIVSGVSAAAVAVVAAAMICVLSVMNGFGSVIEHMFSQFDPELKIVATDGKTFRTDAPQLKLVKAHPDVAYVSEVIENTALVRYSDKQTPVQLMGVDSLFAVVTSIDSIIIDGEFCVQDEGGFERMVLGRGVASTLGISAHFVEPLYIYAPKRVGRINIMRPDKSLKREHAFISGVFAVNQIQYDDHVVLVSLPTARRLFEYDSLTVTSLDVRLKQGVTPDRTQQALQELLGTDYHVLNRYEQQEDFFRMFGVEKLLTALLLVFILLVASFNIISSLTMLIIDKSEDIRILSNLGATPIQIRRIFLLEGWLISILGVIAGVVLGVTICLLQQHYGFLKLGSGDDYILSAYPVVLQWGDVLMVVAVVLLLGFLAAWYPSRSIKLKFAGALLILCSTCFWSCNKNNPTPRPTAPQQYATAYLSPHGQCYDSIASSVLSLDLYSDGLTLDTAHRMQGTGYNLYLSDIFVADDELTAGTYHSETTGNLFTFLPGRNYEGMPSGAYLLSVNEGALASIQLLDSGTMVVRDTLDGEVALHFTLYHESEVYETHFTGKLIVDKDE